MQIKGLIEVDKGEVIPLNDKEGDNTLEVV